MEFQKGVVGWGGGNGGGGKGVSRKHILRVVNGIAEGGERVWDGGGLKKAYIEGSQWNCRRGWEGVGGLKKALRIVNGIAEGGGRAGGLKKAQLLYWGVVNGIAEWGGGGRWFQRVLTVYVYWENSKLPLLFFFSVKTVSYLELQISGMHKKKCFSYFSIKNMLWVLIRSASLRHF